MVDGELWGGATVLSSRPEPLPPETEERLADFAELAATAISGAHARETAQRLADEQAALRRVATLVAQGVEPARLFAAVTAEVGQLLGADAAILIRYEASEEISIAAIWSADGERIEVGDRYPIVPGSLSERVAATGDSARVDDWSQVPGEVGWLAAGAAARAALRRQPDRRRRPPLGPAHGPLQPGGAPAGRHRTAPGPTSPSSSPPRSRTPRRRPASAGWPTSRPRCAGSRRSWPRKRTRRPSAALSPSRSRACTAWTPPRSATSPASVRDVRRLTIVWSVWPLEGGASRLRGRRRAAIREQGTAAAHA